MDEKRIAELEDRHLADVYQKLPVVVERGRGALFWDAQGREYIDCMGGYGVAIVGHCNPRVVEAVKKQAERLITCHGSFYNDVRAELLEKLTHIAPKGLQRVFLGNSGAESVECALKLARRHTGRPGIVAMTGSYHGKTLGALTTTWGQKYREPFQPLLPEVSFTPFGDAEKAEQTIGERTAAVIVEPIQGESGIHVPPDGFLPALRELCNRKGALLIFDEVQSGLGRTGRMWAGEHWGVEPDILCVAKGIAGGLPMGATLAKSDVMSAFRRGEHSSTFGANPLACAAASATIDYILEEGLVERAAELGRGLKSRLQELGEAHHIVREVRGRGLMLGMELRFDVRDIILGGLGRGVALLYSGKNILRLLPPLVIEEGMLQKVAETLDALLAEEEAKRTGKAP